MKNSNQIEQHKLSNKYTIYKIKYDSFYSKEELIKRVEQNRLLKYKSNIKNNHSVTLNIDCDEFFRIDNFFVSTLKDITNTEIDKISKFSWVYTQTQDFSTDWMHNHKNLHRFDKSKLTTEWVCVYYIQIPPNMIKGEGDLLFKTETGELHSFTPEENQVIIFSGEIDHMTTPSQGSEVKRISYVSNFNFLNNI